MFLFVVGLLNNVSVLLAIFKGTMTQSLIVGWFNQLVMVSIN